MTNLLVKIFIKNADDINNDKVREHYGMLSSFVGIFCNICLFVIKFLMGILSNSIAITSDAFNNLSDCVSCVITLFGYRLAAKPADKDHPFGHGRMEYIVSIIISFLIFLVGFELLKTSFDKLIHPNTIVYSNIVLIIMIITVLVKIWMSMFNKKLGKKINNTAMIATATDSMNDVIATSTTIIALVLSRFTSLPVDGVMGIVVSFFILYSGYGILNDTLSDLLGKPADRETVENIEKIICDHDDIIGIHDLIIHDYGPGKAIGSCHVEVEANADFVKTHDLIDEIEKEIGAKLHIMMTLHMDPVDTSDELTKFYKEKVNAIVKNINSEMTIHDFRIVSGPTHNNLIFDCVIPFDCKYSKEEIKKMIDDQLQEDGKQIFTVITFDSQFVS